MNIDSIKRGIVLDHIKAGRSMDIYKSLHLDELECSVAIIKNVKSNAMGRKDIIKIDDDITIDLDVLGYIDPGITVNIIKDGKIVKREQLTLPKKITGVIKCANPRCITSTEQEIVHEFYLANAEKKTYRCKYCDTDAPARNDRKLK